MNINGILFFDTETTGKPKRYDAPVSDVDNYPRLVQIGWIAYDCGTYVGHKEYIIKPDGFEIPAEVSKIHGITTEMALAKGVPIAEVLHEFWEQWVKPSDLIVGHNISFDVSVVGAEYWRLLGHNPLEAKPTLCTMKSTTDFCKIPGNYGKYKWAKLTELWERVFPDKPYPQTHTALDDIKHTADCYFALVERGILVPEKMV